MKKKIKTSMNFPSPINISYWWNLGSLLGIFLMIQIISGIFLSMHYCPNTLLAFDSIIHIIQNVKFGWLLHNIHMNGASFFFLLMYSHILRGIYYHSFKLIYTWITGTTIFIMSMMTAFLGYVLPWGQMSFWGATVITNLISAIPYLGNTITQWLWGGFSISNATLTRFFSLHFIMPFLIFIMVLIHLIFLHMSGSSNPLGLTSDPMKIPFNFYFSIKDIYGFIIMMMFFTLIILQHPYIMSDPENFIFANLMMTPIHIQPEWYFLFSYAILRSIPSKMGGIIAMMSAILIFYIFPLLIFQTLNSNQFYYLNQFMYWSLLNLLIMLTWLGTCPIEYPFIMMSQISSLMYFTNLLILMLTYFIWDMILMKYN